MSPTITVAAAPDPVAILASLLRARADAAGDTAPVLRSRRAPGDTPPYALLREAGNLRARHAPVLNPARVTLTVYGLDDDEATARYRRFAQLLHGFGPAIVTVGDDDFGVWRVFDETGVQAPIQEPQTGWWVAAGVFDLYMTDRSVD